VTDSTKQNNLRIVVSYAKLRGNCYEKLRLILADIKLAEPSTLGRWRCTKRKAPFAHQPHQLTQDPPRATAELLLVEFDIRAAKELGDGLFIKVS
jgi:hypothetical protein